MFFLKLTFYVMFAIIAAVTGYLFWQNRGSEKVVVAFWSTLTLGTMATLISLLFNVKAESKDAEFLSIYTIDLETKSPLLPNNKMWLRMYTDRNTILGVSALVGELRSVKPQLFTKQDVFGIDLYSGVVLRNVFDTLTFAYGHGWMSNVRRFEIPQSSSIAYSGAVQPASPSDFIDFSKFQALFPKRGLGQAQPASPFSRFGVPKGTFISSKDEESGQEFTLEDSFCTVRISSSYAFGSNGTAALKGLLSLSDADDEKFATLGFIVKVEAKFKVLRDGHPEMPAHKRWVDGMISELRQTMDSEAQWKRLSDFYVLQRAAAADK
jgi:hypothetical protein